MSRPLPAAVPSAAGRLRWAASLCLVLAGALAGAACGQPLTQVLLVVDSDLDVPSGLDEVRVDLIGPDGTLKRSEGRIGDESELPRTLAVVHRGGALGPVRVTVTGLQAGRNVVQRRASFYFVEGEVRVLRLALLRSCVGIACGPDETCGANGCRSIDVPEAELIGYGEGVVGRLDAGGFDASTADGGEPGCVTTQETCNEQDDDCDGRTDEDFDLQIDVRHCGACGNRCGPVENAASACEGGACVLRCDPGYADCNGDPADGCEAALDEPAHCGGCDNACGDGTPLCEEGASGFGCVASCAMGTELCGGTCVALASNPRHCGACDNRCPAADNAVPTCMGGSCGFECDPGYADCNGDPSDGCESDLREIDHCGACGARCQLPGAVASCASGTCELIGCAPLRGDCDGDPANGCEADLSSDVTRCGACGNACEVDPANGSIACVAGACTLSCDAGFSSCDMDTANGCESLLSSPDSCGACGIRCADPTPVCESTTGGYVCSDGCGGTVCGSSCVDTRTDPSHCGGCDTACAAGMNAAAVCDRRRCDVVCDAGYGDCDGDGFGCEVSLDTDPGHCGACGDACPTRPNAAPTCSGGECGFSCAMGFADCDGDPSNGCEVDLTSDVAHCGACDAACTVGPQVGDVACTASVCTVERCVGSWADCDANAANGCEIDTATNSNHCGGCDVVCGGGQACCSGSCEGPPPHCP